MNYASWNPLHKKHALSLHVIKEHLNENENEYLLNDSNYKDIFVNLSSQLRITKPFQSTIRIKKWILNHRDPDQTYPGTNLRNVG